MSILEKLPGFRRKYRRIRQLERKVEKLKSQRDRAKARAGRRKLDVPDRVKGLIADKRAERTDALLGGEGSVKRGDYFYVSLKFRYMYAEIPKAGCTSIKLSLQKAELEDAGLEVTPLEIHARELMPLLKPAQIPRLDPSRFFKFVFVRNPYSRVLSAYLDKVRQKKTYRSQILEALGREDEGEESVSLLEFLTVLRDQEAGEMDPHWRPQGEICAFGSLGYDFVGKFENLEADFAEAVARFGGPGDCVSRRSLHATNAAEKISDYFTPDCFELANEIYRADFEYFGYPLLDGSRNPEPGDLISRPAAGGAGEGSGSA